MWNGKTTTETISLEGVYMHLNKKKQWEYTGKNKTTSASGLARYMYGVKDHKKAVEHLRNEIPILCAQKNFKVYSSTADPTDTQSEEFIATKTRKKTTNITEYTTGPSTKSHAQYYPDAG